jgi:hypothetical protein
VNDPLQINLNDDRNQSTQVWNTFWCVSYFLNNCTYATTNIPDCGIFLTALKRKRSGRLMYAVAWPRLLATDRALFSCRNNIKVTIIHLPVTVLTGQKQFCNLQGIKNFIMYLHDQLHLTTITTYWALVATAYNSCTSVWSYRRIIFLKDLISLWLLLLIWKNRKTWRKTRYRIPVTWIRN